MEQETQEKAIGQQKGARPKRTKGEDWTKEEIEQLPPDSEEMKELCSRGNKITLHVGLLATQIQEMAKKQEINWKKKKPPMQLTRRENVQRSLTLNQKKRDLSLT